MKSHFGRYDEEKGHQYKGRPLNTTATENILLALEDYSEALDIPVYTIIERAVIEYMSKYPLEDSDLWTCGAAFYRTTPSEKPHSEAVWLFHGPVELPPPPQETDEEIIEAQFMLRSAKCYRKFLKSGKGNCATRPWPKCSYCQKRARNSHKRTKK
jgi:hypothetical protein